MWGALALALAVGVPLLVGRYNDGLREQGRTEVREQLRIVAATQEQRNRELQRSAELRYTVHAETRDRFFTKTIKEVHYEAAPLADCRIPEPVRVRVNAAAACARGDPGTVCAADDVVPDAR